jgi:hypothetical protein
LSSNNLSLSLSLLYNTLFFVDTVAATKEKEGHRVAGGGPDRTSLTPKSKGNSEEKCVQGESRIK